MLWPFLRWPIGRLDPPIMVCPFRRRKPAAPAKPLDLGPATLYGHRAGAYGPGAADRGEDAPR